MRYVYPDMPELIPFYSLAAGLMRDAGKTEQAKSLEDRIVTLKKQAAAGYFLRGY